MSRRGGRDHSLLGLREGGGGMVGAGQIGSSVFVLSLRTLEWNQEGPCVALAPSNYLKV